MIVSPSNVSLPSSQPVGLTQVFLFLILLTVSFIYLYAFNNLLTKSNLCGSLVPKYRMLQSIIRQLSSISQKLYRLWSPQVYDLFIHNSSAFREELSIFSRSKCSLILKSNSNVSSSRA